MVGVWYRRKLRGTREASNGGRVRVCISMDSTLVIKNSHTYCKNLLVIETTYYGMLLGDRLVGKDHCSSLNATHKEDNQ